MKITPKERARVALMLGTPDKVPTMEIEFQLHEQLTGRNLILGKEFTSLSGVARERAIEHNVEIYVEEAQKLDYSAITVDPLYWEFGHGIGTKYFYATIEDQLDIVRALYKRIGDKVFISASIDGTYGIPLAEQMQAFVYDLYENEEEVLRNAQVKIEGTIEYAKRMIDAGVGVIYSCSDYCFGTSTFYSPVMFEKFVYPFLKQQTTALRNAGAYVIKHTDGNIMQIVDYILDCAPHAIQSIDPIANMDIADFKRRFGDRVCIMGNVNVSKIQLGQVAEIVKSAEYCLRNGMPGGGYIFSTCNCVFESILLENYQVMLSVREQLGYYHD